MEVAMLQGLGFRIGELRGYIVVSIFLSIIPNMTPMYAYVTHFISLYNL